MASPTLTPTLTLTPTPTLTLTLALILALTLALTLTPTPTPTRCDGLAKTVYAKAFDWLVSQVNRAVSAEHKAGLASQAEQPTSHIGVLDIF